MKVTKPFCIDDRFINDLSKVNASELVNLLLEEHFDGKNAMNLTKLKQKLSEDLQKKALLLREIREIKRKIAEISAKEARILKISKQYPDYVFKVIDGCSNLNAFFATYRNDKTLRGFKWLDLKQTFNQVKGGGA